MSYEKRATAWMLLQVDIFNFVATVDSFAADSQGEVIIKERVHKCTNYKVVCRFLIV